MHRERNNQLLDKTLANCQSRENTSKCDFMSKQFDLQRKFREQLLVDRRAKTNAFIQNKDNK